jgi:NADPH-dependent ferric siderophore reductase
MRDQRGFVDIDCHRAQKVGMTSPDPVTAPARRTHRVRHEPQRRDVVVTAVEPISPNFVAVTFGGEALAAFRSDGFDDHIKFIFTDGAGEEVRRDYTPRRFDPRSRTLVIEFTLHEHGAASAWAHRAAVGAPAVIAGPKSSMVIPTDYPWHLLVGDETALPAIHRRIEELPAGAEAFVFIKTADPSDRRALVSAAKLDVQWLSSLDDIIETVRARTLPPGEGFAWAAGEATAMTRLRDIFLEEKSHPREALRVASYWRQGESNVHAVL